MITTSNEFESIPVWEHITGSSDGGYTQWEMANDLVNVAVCVSSDSSVLELQSELQSMPDDLSDDQDQQCIEIQEAAIQIIESATSFPEYCSLSFEDNECIVRPYIDDELPTFEDYKNDMPQDEFLGDFVLNVNDHGNITCLKYDYNTKEYDEYWSMIQTNTPLIPTKPAYVGFLGEQTLI